ncbi:hypothetical protein [Saccharibacillus sacchari]|uniref:hypothetical protein n=1 Tax=Saccharibacillus sacchari TaxID=456493 RepID=UPI00055FC7A0|nr:hypothetical protein [Saccharibacillus sacchari]
MKIIFRITVIIGCIFVFTACSERNTEGAPPPPVSADSRPTLKQIVEEIQKQKITEINIFKSEKHGFIGSVLLKKLSNDEEFSVVVQSLSTASQQLGMASTKTPDYDFVISLNNNTSLSFHYWINADDGQGMLATVRGTGITYTVAPDSVQELLQLLE